MIPNLFGKVAEDAINKSFSSQFHTPSNVVIAFVGPSILIGVLSTAFTDPGTASGLLGTYGILGVIIMCIVTNVALIVPLFGVAILAIPVYRDLQPGQAAPYKYLPYLTVALILVGIVYTLVLNSLRPDVIRKLQGYWKVLNFKKFLLF